MSAPTGRGHEVSTFSSAGLQAASADAQRAAFVIRAIRSLDVSSLTAAVAQEDNVIWARFGNGAA